MAICTTAAGRSVPYRLRAAHGRCLGSGDLGRRQKQRLRIVVLGGSADRPWWTALSAPDGRNARLHLSAAICDVAGDTEHVRQDTFLFVPIAAECRGMVDDRAVLERDD